MKRVLFLYTELADYIIHCLSLLEKQAEVTVIHWPINTEAPFKLESKRNYYEKSQVDFTQIQKLNPDVVFVSGWVDKEYIDWSKRLNTKIVLTMDNQWLGTCRQQLGRVAFRVKYGNLFSQCWVSGQKQARFAEKLGFETSQIFKGFYSANTDRFNQVDAERTYKQKKNLLYLGRYVEHKGIFDLWSAFRELSSTYKDWELWSIGTGDQWNARIEHPKIRHFGFIQPTEMPSLLHKVHAYVLPSHFEPWGVSVHEMASAALPMVLSNKVGSTEVFLREGENGFSFVAQSQYDLKNKLEKLFELSNEELLKFGSRSKELSLTTSPTKWLEIALQIIDN